MTLDTGAPLNTDAINVIIPELETQVSEATAEEESALWGGPEGMAFALNTVFYRLQRALYGVDPVMGTPYDPEDILARVEDKLYFAGLSVN